MNDNQCPNCGGNLEKYRTDHQIAGTQEATLEWAMCDTCSHVALRNWTFDRGPIPSATIPRRVYHERHGR